RSQDLARRARRAIWQCAAEPCRIGASNEQESWSVHRCWYGAAGVRVAAHLPWQSLGLSVGAAPELDTQLQREFLTQRFGAPAQTVERMPILALQGSDGPVTMVTRTELMVPGVHARAAAAGVGHTLAPRAVMTTVRLGASIV